MASPKDSPLSPAFVSTINEITAIYKSLPLRPSIEEIEAANSTLNTINSEESLKLEEISMQKSPHGVPEELFSVLQDLKKTVVLLESHEQKKEALFLVQQDKYFQTLGDLIQRASGFVSGEEGGEPGGSGFAEPDRAGFDGPGGDGLVVEKEDGGEVEKVGFNVERRCSSKISISAG